MGWLLVGATVISALRVRADGQHLLMVLAGAVDMAALLYVLGVWLRNRAPTGPGFGMTMPGSAGIIVLMLAVSGVLWFTLPIPNAKRLALLIGGGPPLFLGGGYGVFLLFTLTVGRQARWN